LSLVSWFLYSTFSTEESREKDSSSDQIVAHEEKERGSLQEETEECGHRTSFEAR
jgi:hypothetical protein